MRTTQEHQALLTRKRLLLAFKLAVTITLCAWIVAKVDWSQIWSTLRGCNLWLIPPVAALAFLAIPISSYKWQQLLAVHDLRYRFGKLQRWYFTANFLSLLLPTTIGGDSYRIYKTLDNPKAKTCAVLAVFVERASGLTALLSLGYAAAIVNCLRKGDELSAAFVGFGTVGIVVGLIGLWIIFQWRLVEKLAASGRCPRPVVGLIQFASDFGRHPRQVALAGLISFVFHASQILAIWLLICALGTTCDPAELTITVALVNLLGLLPISLGGLGLVDGGFIYLMGYYGLTSETALSTMLLRRFLTMPNRLIGGYFYVTEGSSSASEGDQATKKLVIERTPAK